MAGNTLTDDYWANDILWQLSVFAYNISVMMRQKKDKYKKQEHRNFIDWFIAVQAKITQSRHQIELKMYEHHFYKDAWVEKTDKVVFPFILLLSVIVLTNVDIGFSCFQVL